MTTLTGTFGGTLETFRNTLAASTVFQTWCGATGDNASELTADALTHTHLISVTQDDFVLPAVLLFFGEGADRKAVSYSNKNDFHPWPSGEVVMRFEESYDYDAWCTDSEAVATAKFQGIEAIVDDIVAVSGADGKASFVRVRSMTSEPQFTFPEQGRSSLCIWEWAFTIG